MMKLKDLRKVKAFFFFLPVQGAGGAVFPYFAFHRPTLPQTTLRFLRKKKGGKVRVVLRTR
jgi:hypothetical protein